MLLDEVEGEKTRHAHDLANLSQKLHQSEGKASEVNGKYKEQVGEIFMFS